jgi:hypothetical protein
MLPFPDSLEGHSRRVSLKKRRFHGIAHLLLGVRKDEGVRCSPNFWR